MLVWGRKLLFEIRIQSGIRSGSDPKIRIFENSGSGYLIIAQIPDPFQAYVSLYFSTWTFIRWNNFLVFCWKPWSPTVSFFSVRSSFASSSFCRSDYFTFNLWLCSDLISSDLFHFVLHFFVISFYFVWSLHVLRFFLSHWKQSNHGLSANPPLLSFVWLFKHVGVNPSYYYVEF